MSKSFILNKLKQKIEVDSKRNLFNIPIINFKDSYYKINKLYFIRTEEILRLEQEIQNISQKFNKSNYKLNNVNNINKKLFVCVLFENNFNNIISLDITKTTYNDLDLLFKPITEYNNLNSLFKLYFEITNQENLNIFRNNNYIYSNIIWGINYHNINTFLKQFKVKIQKDSELSQIVFSFLIFELIKPFNFANEEISILLLINLALNNLEIHPLLLQNLTFEIEKNEQQYYYLWSNFTEDGDLTQLITNLLNLFLKNIKTNSKVNRKF